MTNSQTIEVVLCSLARSSCASAIARNASSARRSDKSREILSWKTEKENRPWKKEKKRGMPNLGCSARPAKSEERKILELALRMPRMRWQIVNPPAPMDVWRSGHGMKTRGRKFLHEKHCKHIKIECELHGNRWLGYLIQSTSDERVPRRGVWNASFSSLAESYIMSGTSRRTAVRVSETMNWRVWKHDETWWCMMIHDRNYPSTAVERSVVCKGRRLT